MIDHLLVFPDEPTARADPAVGRYYTPATADDPGIWRGDCCIPGVSVYQITGTQTVTDPDSGQTLQQEIRQPYPGWHIVIALPALDPTLQALPGCVLIADREAAARGDPAFVLYVAPGTTPEQLAASHVEPTFAGSAYPFGAMP